MLETLNLKPDGYKQVDFPSPGEYVVLHFWLKDTKFVRAIAVGEQPWGKRGAKSGQCVDGRIVAKTEDAEDEKFDVLFGDLLSAAVHANPADSTVVAIAGESALSLKARGIKSKMDTFCPRCKSGFEVAADYFCRRTKTTWFTGSDGTDPKKFANSVCLNCLKGVKNKIMETRTAKKDRPKKAMPYAEHVLDVIANSNTYLEPSTLLDPGVYDPTLEVVNQLIAEIG